MDTVLNKVLKSESVEINNITWKKANGEFVVSISEDTNGVARLEKAWEFEVSPVSEAISFYWYEYVVREMQQHTKAGGKGIPQILLSAKARDAQEMVQMVLNHL